MAAGVRFNPSKGAAFDARLEKQRKSDEQKDLIVKYLKDDSLANEGNCFLDRSDAYRRKREAEEQAALAYKKEETEKEERAKRAAELANEEDLWIAKTLEENDRGVEREERVIHQLIKDSPELRILRAKLQMAEISRQRHHQLREKRILELEQAARNASFHKAMEQHLAEEARKEQEQLRQRQLLQLISKQKLDQQLHEKDQQKQREHEEKILEHQEMNKLIAEVQEDIDRDAKSKVIKQAEQRKYMTEYLHQQERLQLKKKREEEAAERQILEYQRQLEQRAAEMEAKLKLKKAEDERIYAALSAGKLDELRQKEELEKAINDYFFEVAEAQYQKRQQELQIQKEQVRENLKAASEMYQNLKEQRKLEEVEERERFRIKMLEELAEAQKLEQLSQQRRRMKIEEHKREVERLWHAKQRAFELQLEEAAQRQRKEEEEATKKETAIEKERQRLLAEHGKRLAEFLPPGTLKKPEDLKLVGLRP
ncbi:hypothetical protein GOP47_0024813 [Adiantum capillus-veneris]|uniref:Meiosis-specific nuclear structural protein 1 n=1 Tax=Adiantum capillus-veneris TaxID=13818 RepID=A0A9D4U3P4_ADICA|nr:hypothetical protein GOP47_0024813 [Adiantum capillus-veneris]